jgi:hypothetical protein
MKRLAVAAVVLAFVGVANLARGADDATGTWKWSATFNNNTVEQTLKLKVEGDKLTGSMLGRDNQETKIDDATIKGNEIAFSVTREFGGQKRTTKYKGTVSGDTIKGKIARERDGQTTETDWEAKRQK